MTKAEILEKIEKTKKNPLIDANLKEALYKKFNAQLAELEKEEPKKEVKEEAKKEKKETKSDEKKETKSEEKKESKKPDYDCDDLIAKEKERVKKQKEAAKKRAAEPEKTEVTKAKEKIERTHETIEKKIEKGEFTKAQISKLIEETKDLLKMLEKALKSL